MPAHYLFSLSLTAWLTHNITKKTDKVLNFKFDNHSDIKATQFTLILKLITQGSFSWTQILNVKRGSDYQR